MSSYSSRLMPPYGSCLKGKAKRVQEVIAHVRKMNTNGKEYFFTPIPFTAMVC